MRLPEIIDNIEVYVDLIENTPFKGYVVRVKAAFSENYLDQLQNINVHVLIITACYEKLIAKNAARQMLERIPDTQEIVLEKTGHMFRFSHPLTYANTIELFSRKIIAPNNKKDSKPINS